MILNLERLLLAVPVGNKVGRRGSLPAELIIIALNNEVTDLLWGSSTQEHPGIDLDTEIKYRRRKKD